MNPVDQNPFIARSVRRGFSLVEVLLAIFILGIGLIMVASVFPVGANWTRQATEDSIAQTIAQNAVAVLRNHYGPRGDLAQAGFMDPRIVTGSLNSILANPKSLSPFVLQGLPGFNFISTGERSFQFGNGSPFPAPNPSICTYFWTAVARLNPSQMLPNSPATNNIIPSTSYKYDVYILVFRKGAFENSFLPDSNNPNVPSGAAEVPNTRNIPPYNSLYGIPRLNQNLPTEFFIPSVYYLPANSANVIGLHSTARTPMVYNATPPIGGIGIGAISGTVFRQVVDPKVNFGTSGNGGASQRPCLLGQTVVSGPLPTVPPSEPIIFSAPPSSIPGSSVSPLIYVYQTTMTF